MVELSHGEKEKRVVSGVLLIGVAKQYLILLLSFPPSHLSTDKVRGCWGEQVPSHGAYSPGGLFFQKGAGGVPSHVGCIARAPPPLIPPIIMQLV